MTKRDLPMTDAEREIYEHAKKETVTAALFDMERRVRAQMAGVGLMPSPSAQDARIAALESRVNDLEAMLRVLEGDFR